MIKVNDQHTLCNCSEHFHIHLITAHNEFKTQIPSFCNTCHHKVTQGAFAQLTTGTATLSD